MHSFREGTTYHSREAAMETPFSLIDRAVTITIDPESKKLATKVTAKYFVKMACLIAPELPIASSGRGLAVNFNGQAIATYPGKIRKFPSRKSRESNC